MSLRRRTLAATVATLSAAMMLGAPLLTPASADSAPSGARKLDGSVLAPFQIAVRGGTVWWTDGFAGTITRLTERPEEGHREGQRRDRRRRGLGQPARLLEQPEQLLPAPHHPSAREVVDRGEPQGLREQPQPGRQQDLRHHQRRQQPALASSSPAATGHPARYTGVKDSHPYQVEALPGGSWAVAEAAGNAILRVNKLGRISTIAVLPRQAITFTQKMADALGAPDCVVGVKYGFEPVPTDVERDRTGNLWVSLLPGGPEDPSLGARGAVYKITPQRSGDPDGQGLRRRHQPRGDPRRQGVRRRAVRWSDLHRSARASIVTVRSIASPASVEVDQESLFIGQLANSDGMGHVTSPGGIFRFPR